MCPGEHIVIDEPEVRRNVTAARPEAGWRQLGCWGWPESSIRPPAHCSAGHGFAGEDYERAVVEEAARQVLSRRDDRVSHHEVAVDVP